MKRSRIIYNRNINLHFKKATRLVYGSLDTDK